MASTYLDPTPISYEQFLTKARLTLHHLTSMWTITANAEQEIDGVLPDRTLTIIVLELYHQLNRERRTLRLHLAGPTGDLETKYQLRNEFINQLESAVRNPTSKLNSKG